MNSYTTAPIVCDTGVFMNGELIAVCKHSANAELVAAVLNADARDETIWLKEIKLNNGARGVVIYPAMQG